MKILKAEVPKTMQVKCPHCGSLLEVAPEDFILHKFSGEVYCGCPICDRRISMALEDIENVAFRTKVRRVVQLKMEYPYCWRQLLYRV